MLSYKTSPLFVFIDCLKGEKAEKPEAQSNIYRLYFPLGNKGEGKSNIYGDIFSILCTFERTRI